MYLYTPADSMANVRARVRHPTTITQIVASTRIVIIIAGAGNEREPQHMAVTAGAVSLKRPAVMKYGGDQKRR